jgi:predicted nucleotidyltransferase
MSEVRVEQVKTLIRQALLPFRAELGTRRVMFFGSRVTGMARERSDFDVAIDGPERVEPRLLTRICDALEELPTLYRVDLVDLATVPHKVRAEMLRHVEVIL